MLDKALLVDLESRWRSIIVDDYAAYTAASNQWWKRITKVIPSGGRQEIISWIIQSAMLESQGPLGGNFNFDDLSFKETTFVPEFVGKAFKLRKAQLEDLENGIVGGAGVQLGTSWMRQIAGQFGYWPQRSVANKLKTGHLTTAAARSYDGVPFFSASHPYNPNDPSAGTYSNIITGISFADANSSIASMKKIFATLGAIKMPNGNDPRYLKPEAIFAGPTQYADVVQNTNAKFIAATATVSETTVGGTTDVEGLIKTLGFGDPVQVPELAGFESDTTCFVVAGADGVPDDDLAGFVYLQREAFGVKFYTGGGGGDGYVDAILDRANELEWHAQGRNITGYGHPYRLFKCTA